jgi:deoxyadenosine/deoxycytidine kinase
MMEEVHALDNETMRGLDQDTLCLLASLSIQHDRIKERGRRMEREEKKQEKKDKLKGWRKHSMNFSVLKYSVLEYSVVTVSGVEMWNDCCKRASRPLGPRLLQTRKSIWFL